MPLVREITIMNTLPKKILTNALDHSVRSTGFFLPSNIINLIETISSGLVVLNKDRKIVFMNKKARELLHYDLNEVIGCRCKNILRSRDCDTTNCALTRRMEYGDEVMAQETYYRGKDSHVLHAKTKALILYDENGEVAGSIEVFSDISLIKALEEELDGRSSFGNIIGKSSDMQDLYELIKEVAPTSSSVLITGESGTGKELIADAIHHQSPVADGPLVKVNCGALAEGLLESELFGHV